MQFLNMFSSSKKEALAVRQTIHAEVAQTLKDPSGPTEQALIDLAALNFPDLQAIRDFMWNVAPALTGEQLHRVNDYLYRDYVAKNGQDAEKFCKSDTLVRLLLTYEGVYHPEQAVEHVKGSGAIYSNLTSFETLVLYSGKIPLPLAMEEFGTMLFKQTGVDYSGYPDNAAILKSNREETSDNARYLNAIDCFIIKYSIAELDETRKKQEDRLMDDGREDLCAYRGGRKKGVALAIRDAIVKGEDIVQAFTQALAQYNISYEQFFESNNVPNAAKRYIPSKSLLRELEKAAPAASPAPGRK